MNKTATELTAGERAELIRLVGRFPAVVERLQGELSCYQLEQDFFSRHRIAEVWARFPIPPLLYNVAIAQDGALTVLSGSLDALGRVAAADPPVGLDDPARALAYARLFDGITSPYAYGSLAIERFDDIPWRTFLRPDMQARIEDLRRFAAEIGPERIEPTPSGFTITGWHVAERKLLERTLRVGRDGTLRREERIVGENIPTYVGKTWGLRDGRHVPTG